MTPYILEYITSSKIYYFVLIYMIIIKGLYYIGPAYRSRSKNFISRRSRSCCSCSIFSSCLCNRS